MNRLKEITIFCIALIFIAFLYPRIGNELEQEGKNEKRKIEEAVAISEEEINREREALEELENAYYNIVYVTPEADSDDEDEPSPIKIFEQNNSIIWAEALDEIAGLEEQIEQSQFNYLRNELRNIANQIKNLRNELETKLINNIENTINTSHSKDKLQELINILKLTSINVLVEEKNKAIATAQKKINQP